MKRAKMFRPDGLPTRKQQKRQADRWRGSASERGYNHRWSKARDTFLARNPVCIGCIAIGRVEAATVVDHVEPHRGDVDKFWDTAMWQACCRWHHDSVKQRLEAMYARGVLSIDGLWLNSPAAVRIASGFEARDAAE